MANIKDILKGGLAGVVPAAIAQNPGLARNLGFAGQIYANEEERKRMQQAMQQGMKEGGKVKSASARADGCAIRGKTRGKMV